MACLSSQRVCARAVQEKLMCQFLSKRNTFQQSQQQQHYSRRYLSSVAAAVPGLRNIQPDRRFSTSHLFRSLSDGPASGSSSGGGGGGGGAAINQVSSSSIFVVSCVYYISNRYDHQSVLKWFFGRSACSSDLFFGKAVRNCFWILSITTCCAVRTQKMMTTTTVVVDGMYIWLLAGWLAGLSCLVAIISVMIFHDHTPISVYFDRSSRAV